MEESATAARGLSLAATRTKAALTEEALERAMPLILSGYFPDGMVHHGNRQGRLLSLRPRIVVTQRCGALSRVLGLGIRNWGVESSDPSIPLRREPEWAFTRGCP